MLGTMQMVVSRMVYDTVRSEGGGGEDWIPLPDEDKPLMRSSPSRPRICSPTPHIPA